MSQAPEEEDTQRKKEPWILVQEEPRQPAAARSILTARKVYIEEEHFTDLQTSFTIVPRHVAEDPDPSLPAGRDRHDEEEADQSVRYGSTSVMSISTTISVGETPDSTEVGSDCPSVSVSSSMLSELATSHIINHNMTVSPPETRTHSAPASASNSVIYNPAGSSNQYDDMLTCHICAHRSSSETESMEHAASHTVVVPSQPPIDTVGGIVNGFSTLSVTVPASTESVIKSVHLLDQTGNSSQMESMERASTNTVVVTSQPFVEPVNRVTNGSESVHSLDPLPPYDPRYFSVSYLRPFNGLLNGLLNGATPEPPKSVHVRSEYSHFRGLRGDGNCFYRAVGFGYLEQLLMSTGSRLNLHELIDKIRLLTIRDAFVLELRESLLDKLNRYAESDRTRSHDYLYKTFLMDSSIDDELVTIFRYVTAAYIREMADVPNANGCSYRTIVQSSYPGLTLERYCVERVETRGVDAEDIVLHALPEAFGITLRIVAVSSAPGVNLFVENYPISNMTVSVIGQRGPPIHLLLHMQHYQILYPVQDRLLQQATDEQRFFADFLKQRRVDSRPDAKLNRGDSCEQTRREMKSLEVDQSIHRFIVNQQQEQNRLVAGIVKSLVSTLTQVLNHRLGPQVLNAHDIMKVKEVFDSNLESIRENESSLHELWKPLVPPLQEGEPTYDPSVISEAFNGPLIQILNHIRFQTPPAPTTVGSQVESTAGSTSTMQSPESKAKLAQLLQPSRPDSVLESSIDSTQEATGSVVGSVPASRKMQSPEAKAKLAQLLQKPTQHDSSIDSTVCTSNASPPPEVDSVVGSSKMQSPEAKAKLAQLFRPVDSAMDASSIQVDPSVSSAPSTERNPCVLVVESNQTGTAILQSILESLQCESICVQHGLEALELIQNASTRVDLILMSCDLPEVNGYQTTRFIREWEKTQGVNQGVNIIGILKQGANPSAIEKCLHVGMSDFVLQPLEPNDVEHILNSWISDRRQSARVSPVRISRSLHPAIDLQWDW